VDATIDAGARAASVLADGAGGGTAVFAAAASFGRAAAVGGATAGFAGGSGCLVSGAAVTGGLVGGAVAVADEAAGAGSGSGGDGRNVGYSSPRAMPIAAAPATLSSIIQRFEDGEYGPAGAGGSASLGNARSSGLPDSLENASSGSASGSC
jgi:hypothetical protein